MRPKQKSHTGALLVALFVAAACWGGVTWWDHTRKAPSTPMLTLQDFGPAPGVTDVAARPPRVFLYMEATTWRGMVAADREALLVRLGES